MKYMIIDIGSNTVKYSIFKVESGSFSCMSTASRAVGLLGYIEYGELSKAGEDALCSVLDLYRKAADEKNCDLIRCFATAGFRRIKYPQDEIEKVRLRTGLEIELITGEEEATLSFEGMLQTTDNVTSRGIMSDMGGGSTEIIGFEKQFPVIIHSFPFGALSLYRDFVSGEFPSPDEASKIYRNCEKSIFGYDLSFFGHDAYLVGGTAKAAGKLHAMDAEKEFSERGYCMSISQFELQLARYLNIHEDTAALLRYLYPDRYKLIIPGLIGFSVLLKKSGTQKIHISSGGIRDGYMHRLIRG